MSDNTLRKVLNQFGADGTIEGIEHDIRPGDGLFLLLSGLFGMIVATSGSGPTMGLFTFLVGVAIVIVAVALVYVSPPGETSVLSWLGGILAFWNSDKEKSTVDANPKNRTDTLTQVSRFHPDGGAVERTDGDLVGAVKVHPANLSLASNSDWSQASDDLGDALSSLDFPILIYSSGRNVDSEQIINAYDGRQYDEDIRHNPVMCDLVEMYQDHLPQEFSTSIARNLSVREYYVFVPVSETDVHLESLGPFAKLSRLPIVGPLVGAISGTASDIRGDPTDVAQREELSSRLSDVEGTLRDIDGLSTDVMAAEQIAGAIQEFWTGERSAYNGDRQLRSIPVVVSETNKRFNDST